MPLVSQLLPIACVALAALLSACGDSSEPSGTGRPTLTILSAPSTAVSPYEPYPVPLRILVRDSRGRAASGVRIGFRSPLNGSAMVILSRTDSTDMGLYYSDTTVADGTMTALVWAEGLAGRALGALYVSDIALADTLEFDIVPGPPAGVRMLTRDTALRVGGTGALRAQVIDAWTNPRTEAPAFTSVTTGLVSSSSNGTITGLEIGRGTVITTYGAFADTARVSVVPPGHLAAVREWQNTGQSEEIVTLDTDGGGMHDLRSRPFFCNRRLSLSWQPGHDRLIFADANGCGDEASIYRVTESGAVTTLLTPANIEGDGAEWPSYSADGNRIWFTRWPNTGTGEREMWEAGADGASPAQFLPDSAYWRDIQPAGSPDGSRLAFVTNRTDLDPFVHRLAIYTFATGSITTFDIPAETPRWSPDGSQIAFVWAGAVKLVGPDGTGLRTLAPGPGFTSGLDWSPDGKWVVAGGEGGLVLINVESGLVLPLAFDTRLRGPRWKP